VGAAKFAPRKAAMTNGAVQFTHVREDARTIQGRALAISASVTLDSNVFTAPLCGAPVGSATTRRFMSRTETVTRCCPKCGSSFRIPLILMQATDNDPNSTRFALGLGLGCPKQFTPEHGPLAPRQLRSLVKFGVTPTQPGHSLFWHRAFGVLRPHRPLVFDHPTASRGSVWERS
jgi:hypothetical protein